MAHGEDHRRSCVFASSSGQQHGGTRHCFHLQRHQHALDGSPSRCGRLQHVQLIAGL